MPETYIIEFLRDKKSAAFFTVINIGKLDAKAYNWEIWRQIEKKDKEKAGT